MKEKTDQKKSAIESSCKRFINSLGSLKGNKACLKCASLKACNDKKAKEKTKSKPAVKGLWGYRQDSYTDLFCRLICEKSMTMKQVVDFRGEVNGHKIKASIGPHPKALKRLSAEGLIEKHGKMFAMRVWPKGHKNKGKLTPACLALRAAKKEATKTAKKAA